MCGIAVLLRNTEGPPETLEQVADAVRHRGPDDSGEAYFAKDAGGGWTAVHATSTEWRLGLAHRRLSILDLSPRGRQPMSYRGRFWTVFNGEIYNYRELAAELAERGHALVSSSDTEVMLAAYAEWGNSCFSRLRGMWATVIVDAGTGAVVASRDRLGIKPLYVWSRPGLLALVSEIKQLCRIPGFVPRMEPRQAREFLSTGYELPSMTFFEDVRPVEQGTFSELDLASATMGTPRKYWNPERVSVQIRRLDEAVEVLWAKFEESVELHLRSDVPVGSALSGGLDSSAIAAAVREVSGAQTCFHTFTVTFPHDAIDESAWARRMARHVGGIEHEVTPTAAEFVDDLSNFAYAHDEPVGSLGVYAGFALARLIRASGIKVTLNGQGGDELFSGYWQQYLLYLWGLVRSGRFFGASSHLLGSLLPGGNPHFWAQIPTMLSRLGTKMSHEKEARSEMLGRMTSGGLQTLRLRHLRELFLPRLLKWEDRNSMAFGVEGRYPFLDHELIETCLAIDQDLFYSRGWVKMPLRKALEGKLPPDVVWRRDKSGFEVPQRSWLAGPIRPLLQKWWTAFPAVRHVLGDGEASAADRLLEGERPLRTADSERLFRWFMFDAWLRAFGVDAERPRYSADVEP